MQRAADNVLALGRRARPGPPVAQVVHVQAVQDVARACFADQLLELGIQVRLAEVAAIDGIAGVAFVVDFVGTDQPVAQAEHLARWTASSSSDGARLAETAVAASAPSPSSC